MLKLSGLVDYVFGYKQGEKILILYDIPHRGSDTLLWKKRRDIAAEWSEKLNCRIASYYATYANNADLPEICAEGVKGISFEKIFSENNIVILLNEFSATAPMHKYAEKYKLRVASMPGYNVKMQKALEIDYGDVAKKVNILYNLFKKSKSADITFLANKKEYRLHVDFRKRAPIKDDGNCAEKGTVINLPSGEAFIAPYDEKDSLTKGYLPIEQEGKVAVYKIEHNRVIGATKNTPLIEKIKKDPAVGNIAEMAFGVLSLYGIKPCGRVLLDEKLGMHIALGRDDHFGGTISPTSFKKKENVWHQDFVYIKEMQPKIEIIEAKLGNKAIIRNNKYIIF